MHSRSSLVVLAATCALAILTACSSSSTSTSPSTAGPGTSGATTGTSKTPGTSTSKTPGTSTATGGSTSYAVFNGQGNHLDAYEPVPPFKSQRVIASAATDPNGLDINAQICFFPDGSNRFIAGEDTGQNAGDLQGWGIFELEGKKVGDFKATQVGKLVPTYQAASDNAENYGCGFLSDGRVVTTDIGSQAIGTANGQLIVWFPPFDSEQVRYCKVDTHIATALGILVDDEDRVYVTSARPGTEPGDVGSGVWRYTGPWPTSDDAAGGCGQKDSKGSPLADTITKEQIIKAGEHDVLSPSGIAWTPTGGIYMASVATGVINEYDANGTFVRNIMKPPAGERLTDKPYSVGTPLGLGVGPDGSIFFADNGVVAVPEMGPGNKTGSVRRIVFKDGQPQPPDVMAAELAFPDGIGIFVP